MVLSKTIEDSGEHLHSTFASRYGCYFRFKMPEKPIPKEAAYQIMNDELMLDGTPRLNFASFVTSWMEPECDKLIMTSIKKNYVDMDEYPATTELQDKLGYLQILHLRQIGDYVPLHCQKSVKLSYHLLNTVPRNRLIKYYPVLVGKLLQ